MFKKLFIIIILLNCFFICPEILILENGKIIDGKIIKMDEDTLTVITKNKEMVIDRDKIIHTFRSIDDYNKFLKTENKVTEKGNLIAEWLFNGNANDTSGNNLHGHVLGYKSLAEDRFGNKNSAYEFGRGKTMILARLKKINLKNESFSISLWIKIKQFRGTAIIIDLRCHNIKKGYSIMCYSNDTINYKTWLSDGINRKRTINIYLNKETWYNLVYIYDNYKVKFYLNGKYINEEEINNNNSMFNPDYKDTFCYFGYSGTKNPFYPFFGSIDDIRFYDYAISEEEIKKLYHEDGWPK